MRMYLSISIRHSVWLNALCKNQRETMWSVVSHVFSNAWAMQLWACCQVRYMTQDLSSGNISGSILMPPRASVSRVKPPQEARARCDGFPSFLLQTFHFCLAFYRLNLYKIEAMRNFYLKRQAQISRTLELENMYLSIVAKQHWNVIFFF